jgi:hypothetical protein
LVSHVSVIADKPFELVAQALEQQLGRFDPEVYNSLPETPKERLGFLRLGSRKPRMEL